MGLFGRFLYGASGAEAADRLWADFTSGATEKGRRKAQDWAMMSDSERDAYKANYVEQIKRGER